MIELFDNQGLPATTISFDTLEALAPLTVDPDGTLEKLGINDAKLKAALIEIAEAVSTR